MIDKDKISLLAALEEKIAVKDFHHRNELSELSALFIKKEYPRKQVLVPAGEKWDKVFFVHRGIIRVYYTDKEGSEFNKGFFHEGQIVWPVAPSARKNDILFSIAALENICVSICGFATFHSWLTQHGDWEKFALPYAELFAEEKFSREYEFLLNSATERYQNFCIQNPELARRLPDYHLASYLGITNVSLSRIKKAIDFNK